VSAEKAGFKKVIRTGVEIFIAQRQSLDLQLEVGDMKQTVEVSATQTLLDTDTSERGQTVTPRMYQTLPLWSGLQSPRRFSVTWLEEQLRGAQHRRIDHARASS
jgi:hypothetical protein